MNNFEDKEFLKTKIQELFQFVEFSLREDFIQIHYNQGEEGTADYARMAYTLFTLSRLEKFQIVSLEKNKILHLLEKILIKIDLKKEKLFCLYLLLICKNLNLDSTKYLQILKEIEDWNFVFKSPVAMYIVTRVGCQVESFAADPFLNSIYNSCLAGFDILLSSGKYFPPFYFSDFIYYENQIPKYLNDLAEKYLQDNFSVYLQNKNIASSGVAKALEFFGYKKDFVNLEKGINFLETRKYKNLGQFQNYYLNKFENVYCEYIENMYVTLDTNTHLINAFLNLYEKLE